MVFENGVKNIQAAAYNGARTVNTFAHEFQQLISDGVCYLSRPDL